MKQFYNIPEKAWLFKEPASERSLSDKKWSSAEESVRQWCLHELIRSYGVRVDCLEIERPVKVARERKPHRADIVVLRDGEPYVVVECKAQTIKNLDAAMQQAQNYAALLDMKATYAVATNGDQWHVRRNYVGEWLPVADLPSFAQGREETEWRLALTTIMALNPFLYWLDRPVPAKEAACYFAALQRFFYARNEITATTNRVLLKVADRLLRVLSGIHNDPHYAAMKMQECSKAFAGYCEEQSVEPSAYGSDLWDLASAASADLDVLLDNNRGHKSLDIALMRLIRALFGYLCNLGPAKRITHQEVQMEVQREIRDYLNMALVVRFHATLPDALDSVSVQEIRDICRPAWDIFKKGNSV